MYVTITEIKLKSIWHFFKLSQLALGITLQMKKSNGFREFKKTGFGKKHYTISQWDSQIDMKNFATSANHLAAMNQSAKLANKIVTLSYESESIPEWKEAKILLESKGKVIQW